MFITTYKLCCSKLRRIIYLHFFSSPLLVVTIFLQWLCIMHDAHWSSLVFTPCLNFFFNVRFMICMVKHNKEHHMYVIVAGLFVYCHQLVQCLLVQIWVCVCVCTMCMCACMLVFLPRWVRFQRYSKSDVNWLKLKP